MIVARWAWRANFSAAAWVRRARRTARRVSIAGARHGDRIEITGRLRRVRAPLVGPLSGRACAFYRTTVQRKLPAEPAGERHTVIDESRCCARLLVDDGTGTALVEVGTSNVMFNPTVLFPTDLHGATAVLRMATPPDGHILSGPHSKLEAFLSRRGIWISGWGIMGELHHVSGLWYREATLEEGQTVTVVGRCSWEADPAPQADRGYRDAPQRLRIASHGDLPLLISGRLQTAPGPSEASTATTAAHHGHRG